MSIPTRHRPLLGNNIGIKQLIVFALRNKVFVLFISIIFFFSFLSIFYTIQFKRKTLQKLKPYQPIVMEKGSGLEDRFNGLMAALQQESRMDVPLSVDGESSQEKTCVPNDLFYLGVVTHQGNLKTQMKLFHDNIVDKENNLFRRENLFCGTNEELTQDEKKDLAFMTPIVIKDEEGKGDTPYAKAQYRFLNLLNAMSKIQEERDDSTMRWFVLADDDFFSIPKHLFRVIGKYESMIKKGKLDMSKPIIVARATHCSEMSGGASVMFNKKAIQMVNKHIEKCIKKFTLQYYDYTIYQCIRDVVVVEDYGAKTEEENLKARCQILKDEPAMNCCFPQLYCDPGNLNFYPYLSWYERFRTASGFHYVKGEKRYKDLRDSIPERFFVSTERKFCFTQNELENDLHGIVAPKSRVESALPTNIIVKQHSQLPVPTIDWKRRESAQNDPAAAVTYMERVHKLIFDNWANHFTAERREQGVFDLLNFEDINVLILPSSPLLNLQDRVTPDYKPFARFGESESYWRGLGIPKENVQSCWLETNYQKDVIVTCLKNLNHRNKKWTLVVSETTRADLKLLKNYLETFSAAKPYFISSFLAAQELLLANGRAIGLPFAAGFAITQPFLDRFLSLTDFASTNQFQSFVNMELLKPNEIMVLSGGHFFSHAPEYYCTLGIQNMKMWIEMKTKTNVLEPLLVTFPPTFKCKSRWSTIHKFFDLEYSSVYDGPRNILHESCHD